MGLRGLFAGIVLFCLGSSWGFCSNQGELWVIEQDFVKFGKGEAYEGYKKGLLEGFWSDAGKGPCCTFAQREVDSAQYIYLMPVGDYGVLETFMDKKRDYFRSLGEDAVLPFLSTINFTIMTLHRFLPACSYIPKGKESILSYGAVQFFVFGVMPPNEGDFEGYIAKMASGLSAKKGSICLRTWKVILGADVPKYVVAVFADTEKNAKKMASQLDFTGGGMKNILRSQKQAGALLNRELSFVRKN